MNWERHARTLDAMGYNPDRVMEDTGTVLFARTMTILTGMLATAALTSWLSWGTVMSGATMIFLFIVGIALVIVSAFMAHSNDPTATIPAFMFAAVEGLLLGPVLTHYVADLGSGTVMAAIAMTTGIMAVMGFAASLFVIPYQRMEGFLSMALMGLILVGVVMLFTGIPSKEFDLGYSIVGAAVFVVYFLVDFARVYDDGRKGTHGWGLASLHALSLFLDYINLLLYILRIMAAVAADDD